MKIKAEKKIKAKIIESPTSVGHWLIITRLPNAIDPVSFSVPIEEDEIKVIRDACNKYLYRRKQSPAIDYFNLCYACKMINSEIEKVDIKVKSIIK